MHGCYIGRGRMLITPAYGGFLLAPAEDMSIMPTLAVHGAMEPPLTQYLWRTLRQDSTFVDVGANIGYYSVLAAHKLGPRGRLIAVEANAAALSFLRESLAANWLTDRNITVVEAAASSEPGYVTFHQSERFIGDSSVNVVEDEIVDRGIRKLSIPAVTLDEVLADVECIDILKMDIEGGEHQALKGLEKTVAREAVKTLIFEWNPRMLGQVEASGLAQLLRRWVAGMGVTVSLLDGDGDPVSLSLDEVLALPSHPYVLLDFRSV